MRLDYQTCIFEVKYLMFVGVHCGHLPNLPNGQMSVQKTKSSEEATFSCNDNYYLVGSKLRICLANGTWSGVDAECVSNIECDRIMQPLNSKLIYANEKGTIADDKSTYPMGTFIEIHCVNGTVALGENFLSCTESGTWDFPAPQCITEDISSPRIETTTRRNQNLDISTTLAPDIDAPDKAFWMNLRRFFYNGCASTEKSKKSEFCSHLLLPNNFTDLTNYESPDSEDFKNMDFKLVTYLKKAAGLLKNSTISPELTFENLFGFIVYGNLTERQIALKDLKQSSSIEMSLRLVLCFYIDTILLDSNLHISTISDDDPKKLENITQRIKTYLVDIVSVAYQNYRALGYTTDRTFHSSTRNLKDQLGRRTRSTSIHEDDDYDAYVDSVNVNSEATYEYDDLTPDTSSTEQSSTVISSSGLMDSTTEISFSTTVATMVHGSTSTLELETTNAPISEREMDGCSLAALLAEYGNTIIVNITMGDIASQYDLDADQSNINIVPLETKVIIGCNEGYDLKGTNFAICEQPALWSKIDVHCKRKFFVTNCIFCYCCNTYYTLLF